MDMDNKITTLSTFNTPIIQAVWYGQVVEIGSAVSNAGVWVLIGAGSMYPDVFA